MAGPRPGLQTAVTHGADTRPLAPSGTGNAATRPDLAGLVAQGGVGLGTAEGLVGPREAVGLPVGKADEAATGDVVPVVGLPPDTVLPGREVADAGVFHSRPTARLACHGPVTAALATVGLETPPGAVPASPTATGDVATHPEVPARVAPDPARVGAGPGDSLVSPQLLITSEVPAQIRDGRADGAGVLATPISLPARETGATVPPLATP